MKKLLSLVLFLMPFVLWAQIFNPVEWEFNQEKLNDNEVQLTFKAEIDSGWYVYSQFVGDGGPVPTTIRFFDPLGYELVGETKEGKPLDQYDSNFEMNLLFFKDEAIFSQIIKLTTDQTVVVNGELEFMVCDESQCLPPQYLEFTFEIKGENTSVSASDNSEGKSSKKIYGVFL